MVYVKKINKFFLTYRSVRDWCDSIITFFEIQWYIKRTIKPQIGFKDEYRASLSRYRLRNWHQNLCSTYSRVYNVCIFEFRWSFYTIKIKVAKESMSHNLDIKPFLQYFECVFGVVILLSSFGEALLIQTFTDLCPLLYKIMFAPSNKYNNNIPEKHKICIWSFKNTARVS